MGYFSKKKLYKIVWRYSPLCYCHIEIVTAKDPAKAWKKIKKEHGISIDLVSLEEIIC